MSQSKQTDQIGFYLSTGSKYHDQSIQNITNHIQCKEFTVLNRHPQNKLPTRYGIFSINQALSDHNEPQPVNQDPKNNITAQNSKKSKKSKQSKNKNVLKFFLKLLRDHLGKKNTDTPLEYSDLLEQIRKYLRGVFAWNREDPKRNNINFTHLRQIFQIISARFPLLGTQVLRKEIQKVLQRQLRASVISNGKCTNKLTYLDYLKVYQLRCRNQQTAQRMQ